MYECGFFFLLNIIKSVNCGRGFARREIISKLFRSSYFERFIRVRE